MTNGRVGMTNPLTEEQRQTLKQAFEAHAAALQEEIRSELQAYPSALRCIHCQERVEHATGRPPQL